MEKIVRSLKKLLGTSSPADNEVRKRELDAMKAYDEQVRRATLAFGSANGAMQSLGSSLTGLTTGLTTGTITDLYLRNDFLVDRGEIVDEFKLLHTFTMQDHIPGIDFVAQMHSMWAE